MKNIALDYLVEIKYVNKSDIDNIPQEKIIGLVLLAYHFAKKNVIQKAIFIAFVVILYLCVALLLNGNSGFIAVILMQLLWFFYRFQKTINTVRMLAYFIENKEKLLDLN